MSKQNTPYDVVIAGGGPVGMGLAIDLGQRGIRVAVVERYAQPQQVPKGQNLTQRTMEHFQAWNCETELRARRVMPPDVANGGMVCYGNVLGSYRYDWLPREKVGQYYNTAVERLPQYETEATLRNRAAQLDSVDTFYGWNARGVAEETDGVTLTITEHKGGATKTLRASYLVGCDGSRSVVRELTNMTQTRTDHDKLMVLLVFKSTQLHALLSAFPERAFYNALHPDLDGYWQFLGRVDVGSTWFFHAPVPAGTTKDNYDFEAYLHSAVGQEFNLDISYVGFWDLRIACADAFQKERVFLAGDAAHSHPPYGGYGINLGFEDARNLGWKLAASVKGWGGEALLQSYDEERRNVFKSTASDFIESFIEEDRSFLKTYFPGRDLAAFETAWAARQIGFSEVMAFEPNYEGSAVIIDIVSKENRFPSARGAHTFVAQPGHHLAPAVLENGNGIYSELGSGFSLIDFSANSDSALAFEAAATTLGVPLTIIRSQNDVAIELYGANQILVRPDQFVAWTNNSEEQNPTSIVQTACGR